MQKPNAQAMFLSGGESRARHAPVRVPPAPVQEFSIRPVRVKICGITSSEDARLAVQLGAGALGFNFYPPSPRYIAPEAASVIILGLPPFITTVGVFAGETESDHILSVAATAHVDAVQLHGPQFPKSSDSLRDYPLSATVPVRDAERLQEAFRNEELLALRPRAFLLDSYDPELIGGTGKTIDWVQAREAARFGPIILAGGLNPANVADAIREARPFAVDVASGVESAPGRKDPEKLRAFFASVSEAERRSDGSRA